MPTLEKEFWKEFKPYSTLDFATFLNPQWQLKNSVTKLSQLEALVKDLISIEEFQDAKEGLKASTMSLRFTPYIMSLINWKNFYQDPLRRQFLPLFSERTHEHPKTRIDSQSESQLKIGEGLIHRYRNRALVLATHVCPVYCQYCTRSYSVGDDTTLLEKEPEYVKWRQWEQTLEKIRESEFIDDVILSGGDLVMLPPESLKSIGMKLLEIPHLRRLRIATRGPSAIPMAVEGSRPWAQAAVRLAKIGRKRGIEVCLHVHFNHANEFTWVTQKALQIYFLEGIPMRNQSVLLRGVNDSFEEMKDLIEQLSQVHVQPYYVFMPDLVWGIDHLRIPLHRGVEIEQRLRGNVSGADMPHFVVDLPAGGGKRQVQSFDSYDRFLGVSIFRSWVEGREGTYHYFDPFHSLSEEAQAKWLESRQVQEFRVGGL